MSKYIEAEAAIKILRGALSHEEDANDAESIIRSMPAADVVKRVYRGRRPSDDLVEVVRCRECKHYHTGMFCEKWADLHPHAEEYPMVGSDGYCHYGEKR